jgi:hypothetical protein
MGQYDGFEFEDENGGQGNESGSDLRKMRDAAAKRAKDLEAQLADLTKQLTERNLKDVLQTKNLNPGLAKWISADGVDGSDESKVDEWLTANAALIGYQPGASEEPPENDDRQAAFAKFANAQNNALPAGKLTEVAAGIEKAEGFDAMNAELARLRGM